MYVVEKRSKQKVGKIISFLVLSVIFWMICSIQGRAEEFSDAPEGYFTVQEELSPAAEEPSAATEEELSAASKDESNPVPSDSLVWQDGHYLLYQGGVPVTEEGWKEIIPTEIYYVNGSGFVVSKLEQTQEIWKYYDYNYTTAQWENKQNVWKDVGEKQYYFNETGNCTIIYHVTAQTCRIYSSGGMEAVKRKSCRLSDGKLYYFNAAGVRVSTEGWQKVSAKEYINIGASGCVVSKMKKPGPVWKFYDYNYEESKWEKQKAVWKTVEGKEYYFNKSGNCTRIYTPDTKKCTAYSKGEMKLVKNKITKLRDGRIYYFNAKGIRVSQKGWKVISGSKYVQIGKKGYVTCEMKKEKGIFRYYSYNYSAAKWQKQTKVWKTVRKSKYYFNASGNCVRIYNTEARKCYDVIKGKKTLVKNDVRVINKNKYYFGVNGVRASSAGMYLTSSGKLICTDAKGKVVKEIPGQVLSYETWDGKITSCKVQEGNFMCYYNGDGSQKRRIDLNGPMVALTYDDGPSQFTPAILDILRQYGGVATFFVVGQRVPFYTDTVRSAYNMGCEIGNHTYSHQVLTKVGTPSIQMQVNTTNTAVQNVTGVSPVVMRPPGGGHNPTVRTAVNMPMILWSIDTLDWKTRNASSTQAAVLNHVNDGDIILMHDLYNPTAEASRVIIPELVRRGYQLVTVSELADCRGGMTKGAVYHAFRR